MSEYQTKTVFTKKFYLEISNQSLKEKEFGIPKGYSIEKNENLDAETYLKMYSAIGEGYNWTDRLLMDKNELLQIIHNKEVYIYPFYEGANFAGYCEFDYRNKPDVELVYFGLIPNYQGKGIGKQFLNSVLNMAFHLQPSPNRLWLTTCDMDHPSALTNYLKRGFTIFDEKTLPQLIII